MKNYSKINQEFISLFKKINEFLETDHLSDFSLYNRGKWITANIKVYKWLDSDDVDAVIKKHGLKKSKKIHKEFNDERLFGIVDHVNQWEIECFKELFTWKDKTGNVEWDNALDAICAQPEDVWQFGRSGGHLSFCEARELEFEYNENDATFDATEFCNEFSDKWTNHELNEFLREQLGIGYKDKKRILSNYRHELKEMQAKVDACKYLEKEIERMAKNIDYADQLEQEILEFIGENQKAPNCKISIEGEKMKTSL